MNLFISNNVARERVLDNKKKYLKEMHNENFLKFYAINVDLFDLSVQKLVDRRKKVFVYPSSVSNVINNFVIS